MCLSLRPAIYAIIIACYMTGFISTAFGQQGIKKEGRFIANVSGQVDDEYGLMKNFDLEVQWWTLLGEPIEFYKFRWFDTDQFTIDGKTIHRSQLTKYPDLVKRFDNLRPLKINILLSGNFDESEEGVKTPPDLLRPFYSSGNYKIRRNTQFKYLVNDVRLIRAKSGKWGTDIIPISPRDWEHFLQYKTFIYKNSPTLWGLVQSNRFLNGTEGLSKLALDVRRKQLHKIFTVSKTVSLQASLAHLEWPLYEMRNIVEKFERYEKGEEAPSPKEIVEKRMREEVESLEEYRKKDFWSEVEKVEVDRVELYTDANGNKGVRYARSGVPVNIPGEVVGVTAGKYVLVDTGTWKRHKSCRPNIKKIRHSPQRNLVDLSGKVLLRNITSTATFEEVIKVYYARCVGRWEVFYALIGDVEVYDFNLNLISSESNVKIPASVINYPD